MSDIKPQASTSGRLYEEFDEQKIMRSNKLVYVAGIYQRIGTNFIGRILINHKDMCRPEGHWELPILDASDDYLNFFHNFSATRFNNRLDYKLEDFCRVFGEGMLQLMYDRVAQNKNAKYIVQKNPGTLGLKNFKLFFPEAKLIILLRDGKDVMASYLSASKLSGKKFNPRRYWLGYIFCKNFRDSALRILDYVKSNHENVLVVKYEDLTDKLEPQLLRIAEFLEIEADRDWLGACAGMSVKGSTFYSKSGEGDKFEEKGNSTNWLDQKKTENFKPIGRYKKFLNSIDLLIFNKVAGKWNKALGYIE